MQVAVRYINTSKYNVELFYDADSDSPADWGNFTLETFGRDKVTDVDVDQYLTESGKMKPSIQAKLKAGTAFLVDYFEHGQCKYSVAGGHRDRWDTSPNAGIIFLEKHLTDGASFEERKQIAEQELETYTLWANGEVYGYTITDNQGNVADSLCGLYDLEAVAENIKMEVDGIQINNITWSGEAETLGQYVRI